MDEPMDYKKFVKVNCAWQSNVDGMDIENCVAVRLQPNDHKTAKFDILGLIEESHCSSVNFAKPKEHNDFFVNISCDTRYIIKEIVVNSEAKTLELFGKTGEYLSTHTTSFNNSDEFPMNIHTIHLNSIECSLKFEQLNNSDFAWIFGILILLGETHHSNLSLGPINMQNVQNLLNPELMPTNASKLLSLLSKKESKSTSNNFLDSILTLQNLNLVDDSNSSQVFNKSFKQFQKGVDNKLDNMSLQLNTIENQIDSLNKKFNILLNVLIHDSKVVPDIDKT